MIVRFPHIGVVLTAIPKNRVEGSQSICFDPRIAICEEL
jgi:hypothetical protein